ncbi:hypothetical protein Agabi119p4_10493 [Agaricus bisporus var. burnettii]|uniref:Uncharacterized protein n=1 Tax=Agaricus bisporus var. burnettii TaxID=192524 RepID=A0A8H7C1N6_AGABI|nr:hypothetical protein Agabi119p4_10493 [Agaricus bisporus var. burnettii]
MPRSTSDITHSTKSNRDYPLSSPSMSGSGTPPLVDATDLHPASLDTEFLADENEEEDINIVIVPPSPVCPQRTWKDIAKKLRR